jgi:hypothetical protein
MKNLFTDNITAWFQSPSARVRPPPAGPQTVSYRPDEDTEDSLTSAIMLC